MRNTQEIRNTMENKNQDDWITFDELYWLIEQAENLEKIKKLSNVEEITLADFAKEVLRIIEGREIPIRNPKKE